jgi:hypothetical protein
MRMKKPRKMSLRVFVKKNAVNETAMNIPFELKSICEREGMGWQYKNVGSSQLIVAYNNLINRYFVFKRMGGDRVAIHNGKMNVTSDTLRAWSR